MFGIAQQKHIMLSQFLLLVLVFVILACVGFMMYRDGRETSEREKTKSIPGPESTTQEERHTRESEHTTTMQTQTSRANVPGNGEGTKMRQNRYYVQGLTEQIFLVRERMSVNGVHGPDDRIVRSFDMRQDAYKYAESINDQQRKPDEREKAL